MINLKEMFHLNVAKDRLTAELCYNDSYDIGEKEINITANSLLEFLKESKISFGIKEDALNQIANNFSIDLFPLIVAEGFDSKDGVNGKLEYKLELDTEVDRSEGWDFREVMRIPTVQAGKKLAKIIAPSKGENGKNVHGKEILPRPGKPIVMRPGKNVKLNEDDQTFYATAEGQVNFGTRAINVFTVYEVFEDISMKTGNVNFSGTVVIRGDVPTGFTVKATGDIKIFGLVEAATIDAGGSVFISEGIAGLTEGMVTAGEDVNIGYINQGIVKAGNNITVENSILHSECSAGQDIVSQRGNIIGGVLSAGRTINAKDIGNRMNTLTHISFGVDKKVQDEQTTLEKEKESLTDNLRKLSILREKMDTEEHAQSSKNRITLLKLRHSYNRTKEQLDAVNKKLDSINASLGNLENTSLKVKGTIFSNVVVSYGKYQRTIDRDYDNVSIKMDKNDIVISPY